MIQLDRYIRNSVLLAMMVVLTVLTLLDIVFSLLDQMADTGGGYTVLNAVAFVFLTTPTTIYEMIPFSALGGALIGLGVLASHSELIVIQSAGVPIFRIVFSVIKPTLFVMLFGLLLGEYVSPSLEQMAQSNKAIQQSGTESINPEQGTWRKLGDEFIHINVITPGGRELFGVTRYKIDAKRQVVLASFAESARYIEDPLDPYWQLSNLRESHFGSGSVTPEQYSQKNWKVNLSPELLSVLLVDPDEQSISGLYQFANYFENQGLDSDPYFLAFWKKLLQPFSTAVLVILATSFVFGPLREAAMGVRVFSALGVGLIFTILQRMMEPASLLFGFSPILAVLTPIIACAVIGFYFLYRVR
ncbi:LPS export ABC transporter permease LptG [Gammaproteobacteria bacterium]|nr:LPS export ABC transporter permease LptG [Gammaproteobacteria bacterium]